jgi:hypothetical protein
MITVWSEISRIRLACSTIKEVKEVEKLLAELGPEKSGKGLLFRRDSKIEYDQLLRNLKEFQSKFNAQASPVEGTATREI